MEKTITTCDGCGDEAFSGLCLTSSQFSPDPSVVEGVSNLLLIQPFISRAHHFCGPACLEDWLVKTKPTR